LEIEKYLNPQQIRAVEDIENPLLVIAGAGSGKTRVLTFKIAYLIKDKGFDPFSILAITFTNKAANEMKRRVIDLVGKVGEYMWVSTFHSFCARILRVEIDRLGISRSFVIYDSDDQLKLITKCIKQLDMDPKKTPPKLILAIISDAKNRLIDYQDFAKNAYEYYDKIAAEVYPIYQDKLIKANALDFDDLLMYAVNILNLFPEVRQKYQQKFKYILVDEFQDTNLAQNQLVLILSHINKKICVVGDDDQSIYSWRGADIKNIIEFDKNFNNTKIIKLEQNYRSTKNIIEAANKLISVNEKRKKKNLWTENQKGEMISKYLADDEKSEIFFIVKKIKGHIKEKGKKYKDFSIFYRTNAQSRAVEEIFMKENIPYRIYGGLKFYDRLEIKDMLAYLKFISNPKDIISLTRVVNVPSRKIGKTTIDNIEKHSRRQEITFCEAFYSYDEILNISDSVKQRIQGFNDLISRFRNYAVEHTIDELLTEIWTRTGYMRALENENTIEALNRIENLRELLTVAKEFKGKAEIEGEVDEDLKKDGLYNLRNFLEDISLITDIDSYDENSDAVVMMTLHNAKGLEFPIVFIIGMEEGIFPHSRSMQSSEEMEEERRLCYVGITRAMEKVYLSGSISHSIYGDTSYRTVSRFLKDIPKSLLIDENKKKSLLFDDIKIEKKYIVLRPGDMIEHKMWGIGEVLRVKELSGDSEIDVVFRSVGLKHLITSFAPIKKTQD
jgi:DNA helicase II / ATP-dependent DNA helicase PcrA